MIVNRAIAILAALGLSLITGGASAEADPAAVERSLVQTERLIEESSAAKQVEKGGTPEAHAKRDEARALYAKAKAAHAAGREDEAMALSNQAKAVMFAAVRLAKPAEVMHEKHVRDYKTKEESVNALMDALKRVGQEKNKQAEVAQVEEQMRGVRTRVEALVKADKYPEAIVELDKGYQILRITLQTIKDGDTVTRSLNFASKAEEYQYELQRNDSHKLLVEVLVAEKSKSNPALAQRTEQTVAQANDLRAQAEQAAKSGNHEEAVRLMEEATKQLIRAIRGAGIFIPG